MAQERQRAIKRKRHGFLKFVSAVLVLAIIVLALGLFFRTETIVVEGNTKYYDEDIIEISGIQTGKSLYSFNKFKAIERIQASFAYASQVKIRRRIPDTVVITITEAVPAAVIVQGGTYWLMDSDTRLLEQVDAARAEPYMTISGITLSEPREAAEAQVVEDDEIKLRQLKNLLAALDENGLTASATAVDVGTVSSVSFCYEDRLRVNLGDGSEIEANLRYFTKILSEIPETDSGTVTFTESKTASFIADT